MTRFEYYASSPGRMAELIESAVDDALEAEGCSMYLKLPDPEVNVLWEDWLREDAERNE